MKVGVVLNPVAGGGRIGSRWAGVAAALDRHFEAPVVLRTTGRGEATALARQLALEGCGLVVAAGGDGTVSEVADGVLQANAASGGAVELGILPCGTGSDFALGMAIPHVGADAVARLAEGAVRRVDAGRISFVADDGCLRQRHFVNIASLGLSGATDRAMADDRGKGLVPARALFFWRTVREFLRYRFEEVRITVDDTEPFDARIALVAVCNGRFFGGGMMIAPDAEADDGLFDIIILRAAGKPGLIRDIRLIYGGRHRNHPAITILRGRRVLVEPIGAAALIDIDGESPGRIPATFEVLPGALLLRGLPPKAPIDG